MIPCISFQCGAGGMVGTPPQADDELYGTSLHIPRFLLLLASPPYSGTRRKSKVTPHLVLIPRAVFLTLKDTSEANTAKDHEIVLNGS